MYTVYSTYTHLEILGESLAPDKSRSRLFCDSSLSMGVNFSVISVGSEFRPRSVDLVQWKDSQLKKGAR